MREIEYRGYIYQLINIQSEADGTFTVFVIDKDKIDWFNLSNLREIEVSSLPC